MPRTGSCLGGHVRFTADPIPSLQACHCTTCRKWSGGPFMAVPCKSAAFDGPVERFTLTDRGERGFCPTCGTHLYYHAHAAGIHAIPVGTFDDQSEIPFKAELYIDEKPDY